MLGNPNSCPRGREAPLLCLLRAGGQHRRLCRLPGGGRSIPPTTGAARCSWRRCARLSDESYTSLWRYLLGIDLTEELRTRSRPVDEPCATCSRTSGTFAPTSWGDRTWVRLVDVAASARPACRYEEEGTLVIEVQDRFCPWNEGRFRLSVDGDGAATVERRRGRTRPCPPGGGARGPLYLGGVPFAGMAEAGRIAECTQGAAGAPTVFGVGAALHDELLSRGPSRPLRVLRRDACGLRSVARGRPRSQILSSLTTWACGATVRTSSSRWGWQVMNST